MGLSTTRGRNKLEANEIVYFNFPKDYERRMHGGRWVSSKAAAATTEIVTTEQSDEDLLWNPAVEEHAIMRIHRIGQKRQVKVTMFIVKDTLEVRMHEVQARKRRMIVGSQLCSD